MRISAAATLTAAAIALCGCGRGGFGLGGGEGDGGSTGGSGTISATDPDGGSLPTSTTAVTETDTVATTLATTPTVTITDTQTGPSTFTDTDTDTDTDTGPSDDCVVDGDCPFKDPCTDAACVDGSCFYEPLDADGDGFAPFQCGGDDCNDLNPNTNPDAVEICTDADDNDCNGVADCFDPACEGGPCGCMPSPEICEGGQDEDCDTTVDCNDADCIGTGACGCAPAEVLCDDGFDDDCDGDFDCDDSDCAGQMVCTCMNAVELCSGGTDDDCDLLIDCADPDCDGVFPCTCDGLPQAEQCSNETDDDCDGLVDCADPDCFLSMACAMCSQELCTGGEDEDCDGAIDCADEACAFAPECAPQPEICNNGLDDDADQLIDCDDPDCANVPICVDQQATCDTALPIFGSGTYVGNTDGNANGHNGSCGGGAGEAIFALTLFEPSFVHVDTIGTSFDSVVYVRAGECTTGVELGCDDDSGGNFAGYLDFTILYPGTYFIFVDGYTIDPVGGANDGPFVLNVTVDPNPVEQCFNTLDDDGDIYADCADSECTLVPGCIGCVGGDNPTPEFGVAACTDGIDNDCDGDVDCDDDDCSASDYYVTECCTGFDQNGNGIPDDFNCRCAVDAECDGGQMCYDHTANTCGIPCTSFFGDVCPFVAPGSACNPTTQQCEF